MSCFPKYRDPRPRLKNEQHNVSAEVMLFHEVLDRLQVEWLGNRGAVYRSRYMSIIFCCIFLIGISIDGLNVFICFYWSWIMGGSSSQVEAIRPTLELYTKSKQYQYKQQMTMDCAITTSLDRYRLSNYRPKITPFSQLISTQRLPANRHEKSSHPPLNPQSRNLFVACNKNILMLPRHPDISVY